MGRYLDLAKKVTATEGRENIIKIDGHSVQRVIWETENAVIFQDPERHFWRYLQAYRQAWPVIIINPDKETD
jgi:hypothetical protein